MGCRRLAAIGCLVLLFGGVGWAGFSEESSSRTKVDAEVERSLYGSVRITLVHWGAPDFVIGMLDWAVAAPSTLYNVTVGAYLDWLTT